MLNSIKGLIQSKKAYMEAAQLILEDTEIDDSIVLNEEPEVPVTTPEETKEVIKDETIVEPSEDANKEPEVPEEEPAVVPAETATTDELPTPAAAPNGEEIPDDSVNLMTAEIDLGTNTQTDVLPVPPANAADAIENPETQTVDAGFGGEEQPPIEDTQAVMTNPVDEPVVTATDIVSQEVDNESNLVEEKCDSCENKEEKVEEKCESTEIVDLLNESIDEDKVEKKITSIEDENKKVSSADVKQESAENGDLMTEAISLGDDTPAEDTSSDDTSSEKGSIEGETAPDENQENEVTSAVKDKVEEISSENEAPAEEPANGNELLMKKLSALTKSIEDAKALVLKGIK